MAEVITKERQWQFNVYGDEALTICFQCRNKESCHKDKERWNAWIIPAKTVKVNGSTLTFNAGCNILRASLLKDAVKNHKSKPTYHQLYFPLFVEDVRVGSHNEYHHRKIWKDGEYIEDKKHGFNIVIDDYETVFHDCLPGKEWLEAHYKDVIPEPTIEITVDDKAFSANGNFKKGMIENFMSHHTKRVRAGKKMMTISLDEVVVNCGGGAYINTTPDKID